MEHHDLAGLRRLMLETYDEGEETEAKRMPGSETADGFARLSEDARGSAGRMTHHQQQLAQQHQSSHQQQTATAHQHNVSAPQSMQLADAIRGGPGFPPESEHRNFFTHPPEERLQMSSSGHHPHAGFYSSGPCWGSLGGHFQDFDVSAGVGPSHHVHSSMPCEHPMESPDSSKATRLESESSLYGIGNPAHGGDTDFMTAGRPIYSSKICKLKLRVTCDSDDCRQLLEVEIPASSPEHTIMVQCEACQNLITVDVSQSLLQPALPTINWNRQAPLAGYAAPAPEKVPTSAPPEKTSRGPGKPRRQVELATLQSGNSFLPRPRVKGRRSTTTRPAKPQAPAPPPDPTPTTEDTNKKSGRKRPRGYMIKELPDQTYEFKRPKKNTRGPSQYNLFIAEEIPRIKAAEPGMAHKDAFRLAAHHWKKSPLNVKNGGSKETEDELASNFSSHSPEYQPLHDAALPLSEPMEDSAVATPAAEDIAC